MRIGSRIHVASMALILGTLSVVLSGCPETEVVEDPETTAVDSEPRQEESGDTDLTPAEYARRSAALDWSEYAIASETLWERPLVHIGSHPPAIIENQSDIVLVLHTVEGAVALDGFSGDQIWNYSGELIQLRATRDYAIELLDRSGFAVTVDPFSGEDLDREFVGRAVVEPMNDGQENRGLKVTAVHRPYAWGYTLDSITAFSAQQLPEDSTNTNDRSATPDGSVELIEDTRSELTVDSTDKPLPFMVGSAGRYEVFSTNFDENPLVFSIEEPGFGTVAENQDYGGMTDSVSLDLQVDTVYQLRVQLLPESDGTESRVFGVLLLSDG